jgi:copper chaperone
VDVFRGAQKKHQPQGEKNMAESTLTVKDMSCGHCKMTVENAVKALDGVKKAKVNLRAKTVTIKYEGTDVGPDQFKEAISQAGYTAEA